MKANIKYAWSRLKPSDLLTFFRNVIAKMTDNVHFPAPPVSMEDMDKVGDELEDLIEAAISGSKQSRLLRDEKREEASTMLYRQAAYVRLMGDGNAAVLESSGFPLVSPRVPVGIPGVPVNLEARMTGRRGEVELRFPSVHGARGYQMWISESDPAVSANWQAIGYTTRVKHVVTDLESYKAYFFCVSAIGTAGESAQSDPALGRAA